MNIIELLKEEEEQLNESGIRIGKNIESVKLYHHTDMDGLSSAIIAYRQLKLQGVPDNRIELVPLQYGKQENPTVFNLKKGQKGVIVDFGDFGEEKDKILKNKNFIVSDHHEKKDTEKSLSSMRHGSERDPKRPAQLKDEHKADAARLSVLHAKPGTVDWNFVDALKRVDSASFGNLETLIDMPFTKENLPHLINTLLTKVIAPDMTHGTSSAKTTGFTDWFIRNTKPTMTSFWNNLTSPEAKRMIGDEIELYKQLSLPPKDRDRERLTALLKGGSLTKQTKRKAIKGEDFKEREAISQIKKIFASGIKSIKDKEKLKKLFETLGLTDYKKITEKIDRLRPVVVQYDKPVNTADREIIDILKKYDLTPSRIYNRIRGKVQTDNKGVLSRLFVEEFKKLAAEDRDDLKKPEEKKAYKEQKEKDADRLGLLFYDYTVDYGHGGAGMIKTGKVNFDVKTGNLNLITDLKKELKRKEEALGYLDNAGRRNENNTLVPEGVKYLTKTLLEGREGGYSGLKTLASERAARQEQIKKQTNPETSQLAKVSDTLVGADNPRHMNRFIPAMIGEIKAGVFSRFPVYYRRWNDMIQFAVNTDLEKEHASKIDLVDLSKKAIQFVKNKYASEYRKKVQETYKDLIQKFDAIRKKDKKGLEKPLGGWEDDKLVRAAERLYDWGWGEVEKQVGGHKGISTISNLNMPSLAPTEIRNQNKEYAAMLNRAGELKKRGYDVTSLVAKIEEKKKPSDLVKEFFGELKKKYIDDIKTFINQELEKLNIPKVTKEFQNKQTEQLATVNQIKAFTSTATPPEVPKPVQTQTQEAEPKKPIAPPEAPKQKITYIVKGKTFTVKDEIKKLGKAIWNSDAKNWIVTTEEEIPSDVVESFKSKGVDILKK